MILQCCCSDSKTDHGVSIHAPAKGATLLPVSDRAVLTCFNPRPREGGDRRDRSVSLRSAGVSIHAPAKGATASTDDRGSIRRGFNPRPREGGDRADQRRRQPMQRVSIHAPAKGATPDRTSTRDRTCSFNPRPREGGDRAGASIAARRSSFNPRPREGGDRTGRCHASAVVAVSIHAPAKGATRCADATRSAAMQFQSTPPRRGRPRSLHATSTPDQVSIHAPAKGATVRLEPSIGRTSSFNPRPREGATRRRPSAADRRTEFQSTPPRRGRRRRPSMPASRSIVSIHAPAKGRPMTLAEYSARRCRFQSTPPRRGRPCSARHHAASDRSRRASFNPRPREGGDLPAPMPRPRRGRFNPRPREGGDLPTPCIDDRHVMVSIHAPAKGATGASVASIAATAQFQSTPPRRGRPRAAMPIAIDWRRFNPRPREGGDSSTNSAFCLQRNPGCPCEMVTSAGTSEPFSAENFGKPHDLNRLNEVRTFRGSRARLRFALATTSNDQRAAEINGRLGADMLDPPAPIRPEKVITKAVVLGRNQAFEPGSQACPLCWIDLNLEYRVLHPLAVVAAGLGDPPQPRGPARFGGTDIVGHENHHGDPIFDCADANSAHFQIQGG